MIRRVSTGLSLIALLAGCSPAAPISDHLSVTATIYPLQFLAQSIGGEHVTVTTLVPAGTEPHDYEPTVQDMVHAQESQLILTNGGIDEWMEKVDTPEIRRIRMMSLVEDASTASTNPHLWLDPVLMQHMAVIVRDALIEIDPENQAAYEENAAILNTDLQELDTTFRAALSDCALEDIIVSHDAFGYLGKRYGIMIHAIAGLSPEEEPSAKRLTELADLVKSKGIKTIFLETLATPKLAQTIAQETNASTSVLNPLEGLTQQEQNAGDDYLSLMRKNLTQLTTALQCQA